MAPKDIKHRRWIGLGFGMLPDITNVLLVVILAFRLLAVGLLLVKHEGLFWHTQHGLAQRGS